MQQLSIKDAGLCVFFIQILGTLCCHYTIPYTHYNHIRQDAVYCSMNLAWLLQGFSAPYIPRASVFL